MSPCPPMHTPPSAATGERCMSWRPGAASLWPGHRALPVCVPGGHTSWPAAESPSARGQPSLSRPPSSVHSQGAHGTTDGRPADLVPAPGSGNSLLGWLTGMQGGSGDVCGAEVTSPRPHPKTNCKLTSPLAHLPGELRPFSPLPTLVQRSPRVGAEI